MTPIPIDPIDVGAAAAQAQIFVDAFSAVLAVVLGLGLGYMIWRLLRRAARLGR